MEKFAWPITIAFVATLWTVETIITKKKQDDEFQNDIKAFMKKSEGFMNETKDFMESTKKRSWFG